MTQRGSRRRIHRLFIGGLLAVWVLSTAMGLNAEQRGTYVRLLDATAGLNQASILQLHQDRAGFMWIATQGGLHRYDGHQMQRYEPIDPNAAIPRAESFVTALSDAPDGALYVGTWTAGLLRLDPGTGKFEAMPGPADVHRLGLQIHALFARDQQLWVATGHGIEGTTPRGGRQTLWVWPDQDRPRVRQLLVDEDFVYAAASTGLFRVRYGSAERLTPDGLAVTGLVQSDVGTFWLSTDQGLFELNRTTGELARRWPSAQSEPMPLLGLAMAQDSGLWLVRGGLEGVVRYDLKSGAVSTMASNPRVEGMLPADNATTLLIDRSNLAWLVTQFSGVAVFDAGGSPFSLLVDTDRQAIAPVPDRVRVIAQDAQGRLLVGSEYDGLKRYDPKTDEFSSTNSALAAALNVEPADIRVYSIAPVADGGWLVGTSVGVAALDAQAENASALALPGGAPAARVVMQATDRSYWVGTTRMGLYRFGPDGATRRYDVNADSAETRLSENLITAIVEDRLGQIWVGTTIALHRIGVDGAATQVNLSEVNGQTTPLRVRSLAMDADGTLWIGGFRGLFRHRQSNGQIERVQPIGAAMVDTVYGILFDADRRLWMSTNQGVLRLSADLATLTRYGIEDGLQGLEFNGGATLQLDDGRLAFGGVYGINLFRGETIQDSHYQPPLALTRVTSAGRPVSLSEATPISMSLADRVYHFEFSALDFYAPARQRFRYRLVGFDRDWSAGVGSGAATYTNLPAGDYRLEVQLSNRDGVFVEQPLNVPFAVIAPWYATTAARGVMVGLVGLMLTLLGYFWLDGRRQRREHFRAVRDRENRLSVALWGGNESYWDWDMVRDVLHREGAERVLGADAAAELSRDQYRAESIHPDDYERVMGHVQDHVGGRVEHFEAEYRMRGAEGRWVWVCARGRVVDFDEQGRPRRMAGTLRNVEIERRATRERALAGEVLRSMAEAVAVLDADLHFVSINPAFARLSGRSESELVGVSLSSLGSTLHQANYEQIAAELDDSGRWHGELWQCRADGGDYLLEFEMRQLVEASGNRLIIAVGSDVTEKREAEAELKYLANYDALTGLANRTLLLNRLSLALDRARRLNEQVAVLFVDLDRFKPINDSLGHAAGDELLRSLGKRLKEVLGEHTLVARIGGDEFTVVIESVRDTDVVFRTANKVLIALSDPIAVHGNELSITPSMGIAFFPAHGTTAADLLKSADAAMYAAKASGRNAYRVYNAELAEQARQRIQIESGLRRAMERNEFKLVYQPIMALRSNKIVAVEALLRWQHPQFGFLGPDRFIPVLEESGLIMAVGRFVLDTALADLAQWQAMGFPQLRVAVNVSPLQLLRPEIKGEVEQLLLRHGIAGEHLDVEVTESLLMGNPELTAQILTELKQLGCGVSIDDFGTGYSSLSRLKRMPIDKLKIDKSFVRDLGRGDNDTTLVNMIIAMAHALGIQAVAEGVETEEQLRFLRQHGCDEAQGYLISRPVPQEEIARLLAAQQRVPSVGR